MQLSLAKMLSGEMQLRVIDIGASSLKKPRGAIAFHKLDVFAFDPDPRSTKDFDDLSFNVKFFPYAVAGINGTTTLYLTRKSHCSSLLKPLVTTDDRLQVEKELKIECRTLDSFNIRADIIKIDVQGAELDIMRQGEVTISNAHAVELEVCFDRLYADQARVDELQDFMKKRGFKSAGFSALYFGSNSKESDIGFGDMLFLRNGNTAHGYKVILVALIDSGLDSLIPKFVSHSVSGYKDRILVGFIRLLGYLKLSGPRIR